MGELKTRPFVDSAAETQFGNRWRGYWSLRPINMSGECYEKENPKKREKKRF